MAGHKRRYARNLKIDFIEKNEPTGLTEARASGSAPQYPPLRQFFQPCVMPWAGIFTLTLPKYNLRFENQFPRPFEEKGRIF